VRKSAAARLVEGGTGDYPGRLAALICNVSQTGKFPPTFFKNGF
jgi:hypothetical protein